MRPVARWIKLRGMNASPHEPHSIWLVPEPRSNQLLQQWVDVFAIRTGAPSFAPHATLLGDIDGDINKTVATCRRHLAGIGPIKAQAEGLHTSDSFFMSLYLDLSLPREIHTRRARLAQSLDLPQREADFYPHLSLAYGLTPDAQHELHPRARVLADKTYVFSHALIVRSAKTIPIKSWSEAASITL